MKIKELTTDEYALFSSARVLEGEDFESAVFSSFWTSTEAASSLFLRLGSEPMGEPWPSAESTASLSWVLLLKTVSAVLHPNALDLSKKNHKIRMKQSKKWIIHPLKVQMSMIKRNKITQKLIKQQMHISGHHP